MPVAHTVLTVGRAAILAILVLAWMLLLLIQLRRRPQAGHLLLVLGAAFLVGNALIGLVQSVVMPIIIQSQGAAGFSGWYQILSIFTAVLSVLGWLLMVGGLALKLFRDDRAAVAAA